MRTRLLAALTASLLALVALPASAQTAGLAPCTGDDVVTLDGDSRTVTAPTPLDGTTSVSFKVDLSGQAVPEGGVPDDRANVTVDMTWLTPFDYDLDVNGNESINLQPVDPSAESATAAVRHCGTVTITATNFAAPGAIEQLVLDTTVRL
jgi:hypothetical protein